MENNKKTIFGVLIGIAVVVALIVVLVNVKSGNNTKAPKTETSETNFFDGAKTFEGDGEDVERVEKVTNKKGEIVTNKKGEEETRIVKGGSTSDDKSIEKAEKSDKKADKNSDKKTDNKKKESGKKADKKADKKTDKKSDENNGNSNEDYPGKDEGWSPIVSPDDLEK